ncbi:hypothetical protein [uncultured Lutibacter sp.]|uniref:hypothetical protein n=1 Tax=uncultured Lutibacter sp. TaxID=437739 RepID=UPI002618AB13|nr:hypothetical protein [uncultured Lutibacter sp.]
MKKTILILFLTSTVLNSQNKKLIKETIYKQAINNIDEIALENGFKGNETICLKAFFKTDSKGNVIEINIPEKSQIFESELKSFIREIPKLDPSEYLNKGTIMKYGLKMCFKLATKSERKRILKKGEKIGIRFKWFYIKEYFPVKIIEIEDIKKNEFSKIESIPVTENCKNFINEDEIRKCVISDITRHINRKFDSDLASELGLPAGLQKIIITFYISKKGEIVNIASKGSREELREEGVRVMNTFPNFHKGGEIDGNLVDVKYTIPITFRVE